MFRGQEGVVLVPAVVVVFGYAFAAAAAVVAGRLPANATDVDEQRLVLAKQQRQTLGYRLLPDAMPPVDVHQWRWGRVHGPAENIGGRERGGERRATVGDGTHWETSPMGSR